MKRIVMTAFLAMTLQMSIHADDRTQDATDSSLDGKETRTVIMHKNPGCGCCEIWADHLREFGFLVESRPDPDIIQFKIDKGIPGPLMSCHTAMIGDYFVEGHVPARDLLQLLKAQPEHVLGIAVPGMPLGSPGMEHEHPEDFNTIALLADGSAQIFEKHEAGEDFSKK